MLIFIVFVLPSEFSKKKFQRTAAQYRTYTQRHFYLSS